MGCSESKEPQGSLTEQYVAAGMRMPAMQEYNNEFEKSIFMAINMCRHQPASFVPYVRTASKHSLGQKVPKETVDNLISYLKKAERLPPVYFEDKANEACRRNNDAKIELDQETPDREGNIAAYTESLGEDKTASCEEYTMCQWESASAQEFVALELIQDWNREGEKAKHSPVLERDTSKVGISNRPHKKTVNLIQVLYIKQAVNAME